MTRNSYLSSVLLTFDLETYLDAEYPHKAQDRRFVSGVAVSCGVHWCRDCLGRQTCVTPSTIGAEHVAMAERRGILTFLVPSVGVDEHSRVHG